MGICRRREGRKGGRQEDGIQVKGKKIGSGQRLSSASMVQEPVGAQPVMGKLACPCTSHRGGAGK